jgi:hypothetical protein
MCPWCSCKLQSEKLTIFHKSNRVEQEPYIANCPECSQKFTPSRLRAACIEIASSLIGGFDAQAKVNALDISPDEPIVFPDMTSHMCAQVRTDIRKLVSTKRCKRKKTSEYDNFVQQVLISTVALGNKQEHWYCNSPNSVLSIKFREFLTFFRLL